MIPYIWSIIGAIQGAYSSAASTFLASFPTPTLAADLTTSRSLSLNNALVGISVIPNAYDYATWTASTGTSVTLALSSGANGPTAQWTSASVTPRSSALYTTGTRIRGSLMGGLRAGTATGGSGLSLLRPGTDNRRIALLVAAPLGVARLYVTMYTDADTFSATRLDLVLGDVMRPLLGRLASQGGNVTAEISYDGGANWVVVYTAADATAFGTAGAGTHVGIAGYTGESGVIVTSYSPHLLVEA